MMNTMAWGRGRHAQGQDDALPGLRVESIIFEDEDGDEDQDQHEGREPEPGSAAPLTRTTASRMVSESKSKSGSMLGTASGTTAVPDSEALRDASPSEMLSGRPASRWSRIPLGYRATAMTAALALAAGSVAAVRLDRAAQKRSAERFTLAVVDDRYQPAISEVGLNLGLNLVDHGPAPVTVVFLQVSQPGLRLNFYPVSVSLPVGEPTELTLVGVFDCQAATAARASTVDVTVTSQTGISSVTLELKPGSVPPSGWQDQRSAFCSLANTSSGH